MSEYTFTVRLDTTYLAENWKHCSKIIFKYMKNYCSLFFYYDMNNASGASLKKKKKKKKKLKTRKPYKLERERTIQTGL